MIQSWLNIIPASDQTIILQEHMTFSTEVMRAKLWYRGDADELTQFFKLINQHSKKTSFWESVPTNGSVRKIHSGLPAVLVDTLAYIVKSDLDNVDAKRSEWADIADSIDFENLVGKAIADVLVEGDGAFKISVDFDVSAYPIVEFVGAENIEYEQSRGIITAVIFKTPYIVKSQRFMLYERYGKGYIESRLYDANGNEKPIDTVPALKGIAERIEFDGEYIMAVPLRFFVSSKHSGRGKSIFDGGKSDCFDALDEVISQWWDALRMGRVKQYIPETMIPRNPENGGLGSPNQFGNEYISTGMPLQEGIAPKIEVVQPDIRYEAFVNSYTSALLMCLQGIVSPATLGIDIGKMSSAEAQREKKDVTGNTRNTIVAALEKALPRLIEAIFKTYDNMTGKALEDCEEITVSFGEYGAPDFDSRVETVGKASTYGIMSIKTQVEELWGSSKDDQWKSDEVKRIMSEKGLTDGSLTAVGDELA